jgi:hypothetical protein
VSPAGAQFGQATSVTKLRAFFPLAEAHE